MTFLLHKWAIWLKGFLSNMHYLCQNELRLKKKKKHGLWMILKFVELEGVGVSEQHHRDFCCFLYMIFMYFVHELSFNLYNMQLHYMSRHIYGAI